MINRPLFSYNSCFPRRTQAGTVDLIQFVDSLLYVYSAASGAISGATERSGLIRIGRIASGWYG